MDDTDQLAIIELGPDDAMAGLALSTEAYWNQNEADWRYFLGSGIVFGMRDSGGHLVASAALLPYGSGNAWISMVLVTATWRRHGLASRLLDACLDAAAKRGLTPWLDATPAGATVYGPLGFRPVLELRRLRLENVLNSGATPTPAGQITEFMTCDISAMGFDRRDLLRELAGRPRSRLMSNGDAMALVRDGRTARHIGPLFADTPDRALALVQEIVRSERGPLLIDAVATHDAFLKGLTAGGWTVERPFQRMRFGNDSDDDNALVTEPPFAVAGPEYG
ncbi:MAG: GNAT family N-acetyltransferase [Bradyrhizobium sp.]